MQENDALYKHIQQISQRNMEATKEGRLEGNNSLSSVMVRANEKHGTWGKKANK